MLLDNPQFSRSHTWYYVDHTAPLLDISGSYYMCEHPIHSQTSSFRVVGPFLSYHLWFFPIKIRKLWTEFPTSLGQIWLLKSVHGYMETSLGAISDVPASQSTFIYCQISTLAKSFIHQRFLHRSPHLKAINTLIATIRSHLQPDIFSQTFQFPWQVHLLRSNSWIFDQYRNHLL